MARVACARGTKTNLFFITSIKGISSALTNLTTNLTALMTNLTTNLTALMTNLTFSQIWSSNCNIKWNYRSGSVNLTNKISDYIKSTVIRLYLQPTSRNDIARTCGLGQNTVSNILGESKSSLACPDLQAQRELAVNLKRIGIDAAQ